MQKIYGITYGSNIYERRSIELIKMVKELDLFDDFKGFMVKDLEEDFINKFKDILKCSRGGGYWIWKPYIINKMLKEIGDNDILVYIDAGCELNINEQSKKRFDEYIDMVNKSNSGLLRFQLNGFEKDYTNQKTFDYFKNKYNYDEIVDEKFQLIATVMIMRKNEFVINFFEKVLEILNDDPYLFTDKYNTNGVQHRHDQSIMSLLYKYLGGDLIIDDETWFGNKLKDPKNYPIWASRKK